MSIINDKIYYLEMLKKKIRNKRHFGMVDLVEIQNKLINTIQLNRLANTIRLKGALWKELFKIYNKIILNERTKKNNISEYIFGKKISKNELFHKVRSCVQIKNVNKKKITHVIDLYDRVYLPNYTRKYIFIKFEAFRIALFDEIRKAEIFEIIVGHEIILAYIDDCKLNLHRDKDIMVLVQRKQIISW